MTLLSALLIAIGMVGLIGMSRSDSLTYELFTNQMPSAVSVGNAEMFTARERVSFERAALNVGTPAADEAMARGVEMRKASDEAWTKYSGLPQAPDEKILADKFNA